MLHDEAPKSECKTIRLFWYGGFHLSARGKKFHSHFLGLCITRTLSDWLKISSRDLLHTFSRVLRRLHVFTISFDCWYVYLTDTWKLAMATILLSPYSESQAKWVLNYQEKNSFSFLLAS